MNRYWFKPKVFGYGATPVTWEGWALAFGYMLLVLGMTLGLLGSEQTPQRWVLVLILLVAVTAAATWVTRRKTEGEWRWRWGRTNTGKLS